MLTYVNMFIQERWKNKLNYGIRRVKPMINSKMMKASSPKPWGTDIGNDETGPWIHRDSNMRFNGDVNIGLPWAFNGS